MKNNRIATALPILLALAGCSDAAEDSTDEHAQHAAAAAAVPMPAVPEGARVFFVAPEEGATIAGDGADGFVTVGLEMGAENIEVGPAGEVVAGAGHHHVIIDADSPAAGVAVPADDSHIHYGTGQTEAKIRLAPGDHRLTLQLADGLHRSYGPALSTTITVHVKGIGPDIAPE